MKPEQMPLEIIDEDPNQPRSEDNPGFAAENLAELAATIRLRGVKSPISVRVHPGDPERYMINHGARRFRASKHAGKTTIPAYIDNDYNAADQIIENLQRNKLTAREIADYIGRELARGVKKSEIASAIGKSRAFITQHVTLLDLPEPIAAAFNSGRVKDVTTVNELVSAYKRDPKEITDWLGDQHQELTRSSVKLLREFLDAKHVSESEINREDDAIATFGVYNDNDQADQDSGENSEQASDLESTEKHPKDAQSSKWRTPVIQVRHDEHLARLILNRRPPNAGWVWLRYEEDGQIRPADLSRVRLIALLEE